MRLATDQPSKLAAMELAVETETNAPLIVGGVLIDGEVRGGLEIPGLGSLLARSSTDRAVPGLNEFPVEDQPPANVVHWSFQTMVASGFAMIGIALWFWWKRRRSDPFESRWLMRAAVAAAGFSLVALEAGWVTTEVGRQPWIVYGVMRVEDAVTENSGIWISLGAIVVIYTAMSVAAGKVLRSMARRWRESDDVDLPTPYGPPAPTPPAATSTSGSPA
jgi:cytochrome d ubiquinol oxidase subunit I